MTKEERTASSAVQLLPHHQHLSNFLFLFTGTLAQVTATPQNLAQGQQPRTAASPARHGAGPFNSNGNITASGRANWPVKDPGH